jgi:hypothetical protein
MPNLVADARGLGPGQYGSLIVYGSLSVGDGGGGLYIWSAAATNADDGGDWLKPDSVGAGSPGRWQRVWACAQAASTTTAGLITLGANGDTTPGNAVQCSDSRMHSPVGLDGTPDYLTLDPATQVITRGLIDLTTHTTGRLAPANIGRLTIVTNAATTRTNTAADHGNWVRWTTNGTKTFTISNNVAATGDTWQGMNASTSGTMTVVAGSGVTLKGIATFAINRAYSIQFTAASAADIIGGA